MEAWKVFTDSKTGRELCAYTIRGTFEGEEAATVELLSQENGIPADQIRVSLENRREKRDR